MTPRVVQVEVPNDTYVKITFGDGHVAFFIASGDWRHTPETIETFRLEKNGQTVVVFNSPRQRPVNARPFGFVQVSSGYDLDKIVSYWQAAVDYVGGRPPRVPNAFRGVVYLSNPDLQEVIAGKYLL